MKDKRFSFVAVFVLTFSATFSSALNETIVMSRANRGAVAFTHRSHAYDYDVTCDRCHHNIVAVQSNNLSCKGCHLNKQHEGLCHDCHLSNRERDFSEDYEKLRVELKKERIPTLYKAFHTLCRGCHSEVNRSEGVAAPYDCDGCHK